MGANQWSAYVRAVAPRGERQEDIAARTGVKQATISRWLSGKTVPDEAAPVAAFARAYGRNVLEAFIAAGLLSVDDAGRGLPTRSMRFLADLFDAETSEAEDDPAYARFRSELGLRAPRQASPPVEKPKRSRKNA